MSESGLPHFPGSLANVDNLSGQYVREDGKKMNVYDFDGTIFYSDCSIGFALWCIRRHPKLWVTYLPGMLGALIKHKLGKLPNYQLQRRMFSYLTMIDDFDEQIERYWD